MSQLLRLIVTTLWLGVLLVPSAIPAASSGPGDPVILRISAGVSNPSSAPSVVTPTKLVSFAISEADLRQLDLRQVITSTPWTTGRHQFLGVSLSVLLDHLGFGGRSVEAFAINDYSVIIPGGGAAKEGPIVAFEMDGKPMSRREKGPLWIIYPYDESAKYRTETVYSRSIWQLNRIYILPE